jgi:hypothetical protein
MAEALVDGHELLRRCGYKDGALHNTWRGVAGPRRRHVPLSEAKVHLETLASRKGASKSIAEKRRDLLRELFGVELVQPEPSTSPATGAVVPELVELPAGLAELLGKTELPKVRKVPGELKYALADVGAALLGKDSNQGAEDLRRTLQIYQDLESRLLSSLCQNPGQRSHEVKVGDLRPRYSCFGSTTM